MHYHYLFKHSSDENKESDHQGSDPGGGGYSHAIWVCAAVKGMVFKLFSLGYSLRTQTYFRRPEIRLRSQAIWDRVRKSESFGLE